MVSKYLFGCVMTIMILLTTLVNGMAQELSKQERKALKNEIKQITPEMYKKMKEAEQNQKAALITLQQENDALRDEVSEQAEALEVFQNRNEQTQPSYSGTAVPPTKGQSQEMNSTLTNGDWGKGVVFRVQIGALTEEEYDRPIPSGFTMDVEEKNNLSRMVIGYYRDYDEADTFKKLMRKLGIRTAWIVPYKDGRRVPLKEVLDTVVE